jgi:hypothetical protein
MTGTELTITEVIAQLEARGFTGNFSVATDEPAVVCGRCGYRLAPADAEVVELYRFEGASDPGEEAIVVALRCRPCGHQGTLVSSYGAGIDAVEAEALAQLGDARDR